MTIEVAWRTRPGDRTPDNRDFAGIGVRGDAVFCILLDGSTRGRDSGDLVRAIARGMVDAFVEGGGEETAENLIDRLCDLHGRLARRWPQATASYVMACFREERPVLTLHAGDCLLGRPDEAGVLTWLTRPDTLANVFGEREIAEIVDNPSRHRVTRSFRAREFMPPSVLEEQAWPDLIMATDGFWADLDAVGQADFLGGEVDGRIVDGDDQSCLRVRIVAGERPPMVLGDDLDATAYVRVAGVRSPA